MTVQQHPQSVALPSVPVAGALVDASAAPQRDGGQVAAHHGDPELQAELLASLKDMRAAYATLARVVSSRRDAAVVGAVFSAALQRLGVDPGFGARADVVIWRAEGRL